MSSNRIVVEALDREILSGVPVRDEDGQTVDRRRLDVGLIPWFSDERPLRGLGAFIDWRRCGGVSKLIRDGFCGGDTSESVLLVGGHGLPVERLVFVGLGPAAQFGREAIDAAAQRVVDVTRGLAPRDVLLAMPDWLPERSVVEGLFSAIVVELRNPMAAAPVRADVEAPPDASSDAVSPATEPAEAAGPGVALVESPTADESPEPEPDGPANEELAAHPTVRPAVVPAQSVPAETGPAMAPPLAFAPAPPWWIVAEASNIARLRRLLEGPPRAAAES